MFALAWWWLLQSYRKLNAAKFEVINAIEPRLPFQLFSEEWQRLQDAKAPQRLWPPRDLCVAHGLSRARHDGARGAAGVRSHLLYVAELIRQATI